MKRFLGFLLGLVLSYGLSYLVRRFLGEPAAKTTPPTNLTYSTKTPVAEPKTPTVEVSSNGVVKPTEPVAAVETDVQATSPRSDTTETVVPDKLTVEPIAASDVAAFNISSILGPDPTPALSNDVTAFDASPILGDDITPFNMPSMDTPTPPMSGDFDVSSILGDDIKPFSSPELSDAPPMSGDFDVSSILGDDIKPFNMPSMEAPTPPMSGDFDMTSLLGDDIKPFSSPEMTTITPMSGDVAAFDASSILGDDIKPFHSPELSDIKPMSGDVAAFDVSSILGDDIKPFNMLGMDTPMSGDFDMASILDADIKPFNMPSMASDVATPAMISNDVTPFGLNSDTDIEPFNLFDSDMISADHSLPAAVEPIAALPEPPVLEALPAPASVTKKETKATAQQDDFTVIKDLGPAFSKKLRDAGIKTYAQLAVLTPQDVERKTGIAASRVKKSRWREQATKLMESSENKG